MKKSVPFLFTLGLFLLMASGDMLTQGMFLDGLIYSGVAKSMSLGIGSFWHPSYTATCDTAFYAHPPLMMWMLSLWFRVFGASMLSAKMYAILVTVGCAALMTSVWRRMGGSRHTSWMPLLMWTLIPPVSHFSCNNMLEFTMSLFVLGSVWCMLGDRKPWVGHLAGGLLLACAFLTKGLTGLFPLALPVLIWLLGAKPGRTFVHTLGLTLCVVAGVVLPLAAIVLLSPDAKSFLQVYFEKQVISGMQVPVVTNRFYIVGRFFQHTLAVWVLMLVVLALGMASKSAALRVGKVVGDNRMALVMLALAFCGVLPMMISTKQRDFYLLTAYPFLALAAAALTRPYVEQRCRWMGSRVTTIVTVVVLVAAVVANGVMCGKPGRDKAMLNDMHVITPQLEEGELVTIPVSLRTVWSLTGYYYMDRQVSLDPYHPHRHLLTKAGEGLCEWDGMYREVPLPTEEYKLYELTAEEFQ